MRIYANQDHAKIFALFNQLFFSWIRSSQSLWKKNIHTYIRFESIMDENIPLYTSYVLWLLYVRIYVGTYIKTKLLISSIIHEHFCHLSNLTFIPMCFTNIEYFLCLFVFVFANVCLSNFFIYIGLGQERSINLCVLSLINFKHFLNFLNT